MRTQRIRAAVVRRPGGPLNIETLKLEGPREDEALIRIVASGVCHTDISFIEDWSGAPAVLGHEGAGVVEEVGKNITGISRGDHVVLSYHSCGKCAPCKKGRPFDCELLWEANFDFSRLDGSNALAINGVQGHFFGQSSFSTHSLATSRNMVKVENDLPLELLAPLGCGIQTGAGTIMHSFKVGQGKSVAVFGTGAVGMSAVMSARFIGADPIIGIDIVPKRLKLAAELGATHVVNARREDILSRIKSITGRGVDFALDTTGDPLIGRVVIEALNQNGVAGDVTGAGGGGGLTEGQKFLSIIQGDSVPQTFIPELIKLYREGSFPFDRLIRYYDFAEINRAIADSKRGSTIKPVLMING